MQRKKRKSLSIKGLPSVAADSADERYAGIRHTDAAELFFINDGRITETVRNAFQQVCGDLGAGVCATAGEAVAPSYSSAPAELPIFHIAAGVVPKGPRLLFA